MSSTTFLHTNGEPSADPARQVTQPSGAGRPASPGNFRPEIQGLRALAVLMVVAYHFWPNRLSGGFVGVDVFFVISGFLITSHLVRDIESKGTVSLTAFWARRIRRLLPASLFVLVVTLLGVFLFLPATAWEVNARQIGASALYVQNWVLATDAVNYSALHSDASAVQHFWSLSVEEQFYVFWPLFLLGIVFFVSRIGKRFSQRWWTSPHRSILAGTALLAAGSLLWSIIATAQEPAAAYFVTPTRMWEFAGGALLALTLSQRQFHGARATVAAWIGIGLIASSALLYTAATPFPGWTAILPVGGTLLVIAAAGHPGVAGPRYWLSRKPVTFIGDISYAIYLWHWPLLVIAPAVLHRTPGTLDKILLLAGSIVLAWLTKILIEDPLRTGWLLRSRRRTYFLTAVAMAIVAALSVGLTAKAFEGSAASAEAKSKPCYGPGSLDPHNKCGSVTGDSDPVPGPALVARQNTDPLFPGCQADYYGTDLVSCDFGVSEKDATTTVALVGDSHATAWIPALDELAKKRKWHVKTFTKASCPVSAAVRTLPNETTDEKQNDCHGWGQAVQARIAGDASISMVFNAAYSTAYSYKAADGDPLAKPAVDGFLTVWKSWLAAGKKVVAFDDVPRTNGQYIPSCLAAKPGRPLDCSVPVSRAYPANTAIMHAAEMMKAAGFTRVQTRKQFCDNSICYPVVGGVIVYRDYAHISAEYSRALAPFIDMQLK